MRKIIAVLMILILTISLAGCKGTKHEINKLAVVLAVGFDLSIDNKYILTVQVLSTQKNSSNSMGGQQNQSDVIVYSMEGVTPRDAISKLSTELGSPLFFGHSKYTVIGKDLAQDGMDLYIDSSLRSQNTRANTPLLVTNGKASDIVRTITSENKIPAIVVDQLIKLQANYGYAPIVSRLDFINALYSKKSAAIIGVINLKKNNEYDTLKLAGTAVFDGDKLVGFMDMYQTRGMQWMRGKVKNGSVVVHLPDKKIVAFSILTAKSKIKPVIENGKLTMEVNIKEEGNIEEMTAPFDPMKNHKDMDRLSKLQSEAIEKEVRISLEVAQNQYKLDIFNFSGIVKREKPEYWSKIEKDWDSIFPNIKVKVYVDSSVKRPGLFSKSIF